MYRWPKTNGSSSVPVSPYAWTLRFSFFLPFSLPFSPFPSLHTRKNASMIMSVCYCNWFDERWKCAELYSMSYIFTWPACVTDCEAAGWTLLAITATDWLLAGWTALLVFICDTTGPPTLGEGDGMAVAFAVATAIVPVACGWIDFVGSGWTVLLAAEGDAFTDAVGIIAVFEGCTLAGMTVAAAPEGVVTLDSGIAGLAFDPLALSFETLLATLFAMLDIRSSVLLYCCWASPLWSLNRNVLGVSPSSEWSETRDWW